MKDATYSLRCCMFTRGNEDGVATGISTSRRMYTECVELTIANDTKKSSICSFFHEPQFNLLDQSLATTTSQQSVYHIPDSGSRIDMITGQENSACSKPVKSLKGCMVGQKACGREVMGRCLLENMSSDIRLISPFTEWSCWTRQGHGRLVN